VIFISLTSIVFFAIVLALHSPPFSWTVKKTNLAFSTQIFLDFDGYSICVIGAAPGLCVPGQFSIFLCSDRIFGFLAPLACFAVGRFQSCLM
jgi:D-alanyl-lipoteichoic acid acyltransferase DltB (MBOAT superfamily)